MKLLSPFIKCASLSFFVGFLSSNGPEVGLDLLPLGVLIVFVATVFALWELANLEPATKGAIS
jgi:hypothetical protein